MKPKESIDSATGEVTPASPRFGRARKPPTPQQAEAARVRADRARRRAEGIETLRRIDPACEIEADPPVAWKVPERCAEPTGIVLDLPRSSGRGSPGSRLVLAARYYDGSGPNGGEPRHSATLFVIFRDAAGYLRRTIGVSIHEDELRAVSAALIACADAIDAAKKAEA
ncbi:MAG: hypothetical protein ABSC94_30550 [Polyangiaceae bacterium]|jgi:hypothetical protein